MLNKSRPLFYSHPPVSLFFSSFTQPVCSRMVPPCKQGSAQGFFLVKGSFSLKVCLHKQVQALGFCLCKSPRDHFLVKGHVCSLLIVCLYSHHKQTASGFCGESTNIHVLRNNQNIETLIHVRFQITDKISCLFRRSGLSTEMNSGLFNRRCKRPHNVTTIKENQERKKHLFLSRLIVPHTPFLCCYLDSLSPSLCPIPFSLPLSEKDKHFPQSM